MFLPDVATAVHKGIVGPNACGKQTRSQTPGVIVLFMRKTHWWEKID